MAWKQSPRVRVRRRRRRRFVSALSGETKQKATVTETSDIGTPCRVNYQPLPSLRAVFFLSLSSSVIGVANYASICLEREIGDERNFSPPEGGWWLRRKVEWPRGGIRVTEKAALRRFQEFGDFSSLCPSMMNFVLVIVAVGNSCGVCTSTNKNLGTSDSCVRGSECFRWETQVQFDNA